MNKTCLCIGLDPDLKKIPHKFLRSSNPILDFNKYIIDQTIDLCSSYKPNIAFYEVLGHLGITALKETISYIRSLDKTKTVILDAKRSDIGNTASFYAKSIFETFNADGTTLSPYMGFDSIKPFLQYKNKYLFILCLTSNPSNKDFQFIKSSEGKFLYEIVYQKVLEWREKYNYKGLGLVIGATNKEIITLKDKLKEVPLLVPGIGTQKGEIHLLKGMFFDNLFINVGRDIIYSEAPREKAKFYNNQLSAILLSINS